MAARPIAAGAVPSGSSAAAPSFAPALAPGIANNNIGAMPSSVPSFRPSQPPNQRGMFQQGIPATGPSNFHAPPGPAGGPPPGLPLGNGPAFVGRPASYSAPPVPQPAYLSRPGGSFSSAPGQPQGPPFVQFPNQQGGPVQPPAPYSFATAQVYPPSGRPALPSFSEPSSGQPPFVQGMPGQTTRPQQMTGPLPGHPLQGGPPFSQPVSYPQGHMLTEAPVAQFRDMSFGTQNQAPQAGPPPPTFMARPPPTASGPTWQAASPYGGPPPGPPLYGQATQTIRPVAPPGMGHPPGPENYAAKVPGIPQTGSPSAAPLASSTSRIDPNQIPRPQSSLTSSTTFETWSSNQINLPPSATSNFVVRDTGNCSPRMMRSTLYQIPCSGDLLSTSGMPLAVMVQPLALPHPLEEPIEVVNFGDSGPVRCSRCKAYINPFMKFIDQGWRFVCNICGFANETPREYHCNLGPDGRRRDADERPELSRGTVEFVASKEFLVRPPMPAVFFFLVDVSSNSVQTGAAAATCSAIQRVLADLPEGPRTMVGIATFDSTIHFYNLTKSLQQPPMLVVPDVQDVYAPLQAGLVVSLSECREHLEQLLGNIPSMFQDNRTADSAFGAAVKGAFLALKPTGGKLLVFQSVLPSVGIGALSGREAEGKANAAAGEKEAQKLLQPVDKTLKTMAIDFAEYQVCVDVFLTSQTFVDIASITVVPRTTGGQMYYYYPFSARMDSAKLYNDLRWNVTRPQGLEAVMRVRCSQGLQVQDYYGNFCRRIPTDVDLPAIDCDKTIMVTFKHDDKFQDGSLCCFQCALLYTTMSGERRIRINTLAISCTSILSNLFRGADLDAQFTYFLKHAAQATPAAPLQQIREQIVNQCVNILYTYRKFCATASSAGQLILPEALKLLPLYTLALTKSIGLRNDGRVDERSYWLTRALSLSTSLAIPLVYPRLFAIHDVLSQDLGEEILPPVLPLSSENLDQAGVFLLEAGEDAFLYTGKSVAPELLHQLFGVHSLNEIYPGQFLLQEYDNDASKKLNDLINKIRRQRCSYLRLHLLRRGEPLENLFLSFLVEDKTSLGLSYVEFLVHVHRQIQNKMS
ncbi:hypothetical protein O6H91_Y056200 [Diphasiastrum complanatum]|nr:hypothetical protein O6H91_Y056200 [Diphasiastrum complanatum]